MAENEVLYVNDMPLTDLNLHVISHSGWMTGPEFGFPVVPIPGAIGGIPSDQFSVSAGTVVVTARVTPTSLTNRESKINEVNWKLKGLLELRFADQPDKVLEAICTNVTSTPEAPTSFVEPDLIVTLSFLTPKPYKYDRLGQIISFTSSPTEVPLGDLPSGGKIYIAGAATNPVITYRAASGESKETLGFTVSLGANDFLELDLDKRTIHHSVAGIRTLDNSLKSSGYWFTLDSIHGTPTWSDWPTLEASAGNGVILYHRNWSS